MKNYRNKYFISFKWCIILENMILFYVFILFLYFMLFCLEYEQFFVWCVLICVGKLIFQSFNFYSFFSDYIRNNMCLYSICIKYELFLVYDMF